MLRQFTTVDYLFELTRDVIEDLFKNTEKYLKDYQPREN